MRLALPLLFALVFAVFMVTPAAAQRRTPPPQQDSEQPPTTSRDEEARMLFEAGRVSYAAGRFEDALGYFQRAYEISHRPVLLYNVGSAADKLRRDAVALTALRSYLEGVPNAENREEVEARIRVLAEVVAAAEARQTPTVTPPPGEGTTTREGELNASLGHGDAPPPRDESSSIFGTWWFWTIVGVVVVGATVGIIAATAGGGGLGPLDSGDDGMVHFTLIGTP